MKQILLPILLLACFAGHSQWVSIYSSPNPYSTITAYDSVILSGSSYWGESQLLVSTDYGATWTNEDPFANSQGVIFITAADSMFYACTTDGIYRSAKDVFNWLNYGAGLGGQPMLKIVAHDGVFFAISYCQTDSTRVFRRTESDTAWSVININVPIGNVYDIDYDGNMLALAGYNGIAESANGGNDWSLWNDYMFEMTAVKIKGDTLIAASKGGIFRKLISTGNVTKVSDGLTLLWNPYGYEYYGEFESFCMVGNHLFVGGESGVYKLDDNIWYWQYTNSGGYSFALTRNNTHLISAKGYNGIEARPLSELIIGVEEIEYYHTNLRLFPNPASGIIHLISEYTITSIRIFNQQGKLVHSEFPRNTECSVSSASLKSGLYHITAVAGSVTGYWKVVVLH